MAAVHPNVSSPFRATKLWNQLLSSFKEGMQLKRKRWRLKSYEQCFSGADALQWLYSYLQNHPSFGAHVTREQAFMLLQKFLENNVFQGVVEKNSKKFQDTNHLYRFIEDVEKPNDNKNNEDTKEDKENFNSRNSLTNLIRTISKRNSKFFGEVNQESPPTQGNNIKETNTQEKSDHNDSPKKIDKPYSFTPLAKDLNHISLLSNHKDKSCLDYSNVSTLLFQTEDEDDDCDEVFETSLRNHFFTRSNSVQMCKRESRPSIRKPLGTFWINEYNKTELQCTSNTETYVDNKALDKKNDKKKTMLRTFGKTSLYNIKKKNTILGKRKSGDVNATANMFPSKLKKVTETGNNDKETNSKYGTLPRKNYGGSHDSLYSGDSLPRKAVALLGEDPTHIQEVDSYSAYYLVSSASPPVHKKPELSPLDSNSINSSRESINKVSRNVKVIKSSISGKDNRTSNDHFQSYCNPLMNDVKTTQGLISKSNPDVTKSNTSINGKLNNTMTKTIKKAKSFSFTVPQPASDKIMNSPKTRRPARRTHAMVRRSISQSNLRRRRYSRSTSSSSSDLQEGYPFHSTESVLDNNRLYKVPSTWSIDTIGLMNDTGEECNEKTPEITAEDIEETWKSVVILSLKKLFGMGSVKELFDINEISGANIMKNVSWKPSEISRDAPGWLLSAMNCLIDWPNVCQNAEDSILQDLPSYPGFERDVYRAVKEHYHTTLSKPLIPSHLYPLVQECADVLHEDKDKGIKIMQHIILLLPCWNRRQLQLLIHFMNKVACNKLLEISKDLPNRDLVTHSFLQLIVRKEKQSFTLEASVIPIRITNLLIDSYDAVFKAPPSLRGQVDHKLAVILGKPSVSRVPDNTLQRRRVSGDDDNNEMPPPRFYCKQISKAAYEKESKESYHKAINELLTTYITDPSFTEKERSKRLRQFQKAYPEIYAERLSPCDDVSNCSTISEFSMNFKEARKPSFLTEKLL